VFANYTASSARMKPIRGAPTIFDAKARQLSTRSPA
jgi:hypothetical protein